MLMLVLTNYPSPEKEALVQEALAHAQTLRVRLRAEQSQSDQVTKDCDDFSREIARLVIVSKKAAASVAVERKMETKSRKSFMP